MLDTRWRSIRTHFLPFLGEFIADSNKFLEVPRLEVSFAIKIDGLRLEKFRSTHETRKWERKTVIESERR